MLAFCPQGITPARKIFIYAKAPPYSVGAIYFGKIVFPARYIVKETPYRILCELPPPLNFRNVCGDARYTLIFFVGRNQPMP